MIIAIANEKGGVGKSTSVAAIGSVLAGRGKRVVLIDLDWQGDLTLAFGIEPGERNIYDAFFTHRSFLAKRVNENLVLVGGDPRMRTVDVLENLKSDEGFKDPVLALRKILEGVRRKADYILLDCPPNLDIVSQNALACSDYLLVPAEPHAFSVNGIAAMLQYCEQFKEVNKTLTLLGVFLTRVRANTSLHSDVKKTLEEKYPQQMLESVIRENIMVQEATHVGTEFQDYEEERAKTSVVRRSFRGAQDYSKLVDEILNKINHGHKN